MASQNSTFLYLLLTYFSEYQEREVNLVCIFHMHISEKKSRMWENLKEPFKQFLIQSPILPNTCEDVDSRDFSQYDVTRVQSL